MTPKPAKMVKFEAERSLGLLASPHRPKGANVKLDNSHSVILTVPPPGFPHIDTAEKKPKCSIFRYETHKPPKQLLGNYNSNAHPSLWHRKEFQHTGWCVLSNAKMGMTFSNNYQHFQAKPPWFSSVKRKVDSDGWWWWWGGAVCI